MLAKWLIFIFANKRKSLLSVVPLGEELFSINMKLLTRSLFNRISSLYLSVTIQNNSTIAFILRWRQFSRTTVFQHSCANTPRQIHLTAPPFRQTTSCAFGAIQTRTCYFGVKKLSVVLKDVATRPFYNMEQSFLTAPLFYPIFRDYKPT